MLNEQNSAGDPTTRHYCFHQSYWFPSDLLSLKSQQNVALHTTQNNKHSEGEIIFTFCLGLDKFVSLFIKVNYSDRAAIYIANGGQSAHAASTEDDELPTPSATGFSTTDLGWPNVRLKIYVLDQKWYFEVDEVLRAFGIKQRML